MPQILREREADILSAWERGVHELPAAERLEPVAVRQGMPELFDEIERAVEAAEVEEGPHETIQSHALARLAQGFDAAQLMREFALLRRSISGLPEWSGGCRDVAERRTLDRAIDETAISCLEYYTRAREEQLQGPVSGAAKDEELERASLDILFRSAPDGIGIVDHELRYVRVNPALAAINRRTVEDHIGKTIGEILKGEVGETISKLVRATLFTGHPNIIELSDESLSNHRSPSHFRMSYFPVPGREGTTSGVGAVIVNVTDQKRAAREASLFAEASSLLSTSLDLGTALKRLAKLVVRYMADACVVDVSAPYGRFRRTGAGRDAATEELLGAALDLVPADVAPPPVRRVLVTGKAQLLVEVTSADVETASLNARHRAAIERLGPTSAMLVPLRAATRVIGVLSIFSRSHQRPYGEHDLQVAQELADRAGLAADNIRLFEEAQVSAQQRQRVLAIVCHDLRSPLGTVTFSAAALKNSRVDDADRPRMLNLLNLIEKSCRHMLRLVQDLIDVGSIQAGRLGVERKPHDIDTLLSEAVEMQAAMATEKDVDLGRPSQTTGAVVSCDRGRILQVLANLIGNALKFSTPGGRVTVSSERAGDQIVCRVSDNGPGIPEHELPHIFEPYWSGSRARSMGAGLGLFISEGIIEAHGGEIQVTSAPGSGSTFTFALPIATS